MRKIALPVIFLLLFSCVRNGAADVGELLKTAMQKHLYEGIHNDSSRVRYEVKDVAFFENPDSYDCEFTVHLISKKLDTTGIMQARVMKDFKKVIRKS